MYNFFALTDGIFETGAYGVPNTSQNPIVLDQGGLSSTKCSNPSWACQMVPIDTTLPNHKPNGFNEKSY